MTKSMDGHRLTIIQRASQQFFRNEALMLLSIDKAKYPG